MSLRSLASVLALALLLGPLTPPALGAKDKDDETKAAKPDAKASPDAKADEDLKLPPFPEDKTVKQSIQLGGRTLNYNATVGSLPVLDEKGKKIADVMFIAYTMPGTDRPMTFALNGGPGAASV